MTLEDRTLLSVAVAAVQPVVAANSTISQNTADTTFSQAGVASDGSFDVVWTRGYSATDSDVFVQRFNRDGSTKGPAIGVATSMSVENEARIAVKADGTFVVVYTGATPHGHRSVFANVYDANGNLMSGSAPIQLATVGYDTRDQHHPSVDISDGGTVFVASWEDDYSASDIDVRARVMNLDGSAYTSDSSIADTLQPEYNPAVAIRPAPIAGQPMTIVVSYTKIETTGAQNIYAQRLDLNLTALGTAIQVNDSASGPTYRSAVDIDASLNFVVAWENGLFPNQVIKMRRYDANGNSLSAGEERVDNTAGTQSSPAVAKADDGRFIVSYLSGTTSSRLTFQQFQADGTPVAGKRSLALHGSKQLQGGLAASGNGTFAFAEDDFDATANKYTPYAQTYQVTAPTLFAVGGGSGRLEVHRMADGAKVADFRPYATSYTGGISAAFGDVNGDGIADLIVGGTDGPTNVKVYDGLALTGGTFSSANPDASLLARWNAYDPAFNIGEYVAAGDVENDGYADVVTGAALGNPNVRIYKGKDIGLTPAFDPNGASLLRSFFPYQVNFNVGSSVAVGDLNGDGYADVVTGALPGNPHVRKFDGKALAKGPFTFDEHTNAGANQLGNTNFFGFGIGFNVGAYVAVADIYGDGGDLVIGSSQGNPQVKVFKNADVLNPSFDPQTSPPANSFFTDAQGSNLGVTVAAAKFEGAGQPADILVGTIGGTPTWRVVKGKTNTDLPAPVNPNLQGTLSDSNGTIYVGA